MSATRRSLGRTREDCTVWQVRENSPLRRSMELSEEMTSFSRCKPSTQLQETSCYPMSMAKSSLTSGCKNDVMDAVHSIALELIQNLQQELPTDNIEDPINTRHAGAEQSLKEVEQHPKIDGTLNSDGQKERLQALRKRKRTNLVQGMDDVVATTSGYKGVVRDRLIELINLTGAVYTGSLTKKNTHLVCSNFEGSKYKTAKKLGKIVVNHQWLEDCLAAGVKLKESPYESSGKVTGPLRWDQEKSEEQFAQKSSSSALLESCYSRIPLSPTAIELSSSETESGNPVNYDRRPIKVVHGFDTESFDKGQSSMNVELPNSGHKNSSNFGSYFKDSQPKCTAQQTDPAKLKAHGAALNQREGFDNQRSQNSHYEKKCVDCVTKSNTIASDKGKEIASSTDTTKDSQEIHSSILDTSMKSVHTNEMICAICHSNAILTSEGLLSCGHKFCYQCIHTWALTTRKKEYPTCPLCKKQFDFIFRREMKNIDVNCYDGVMEETVVPIASFVSDSHQSRPVMSCVVCRIDDTPNLLLTCSDCGHRVCHTFCLDPPQPPKSSWSCNRCSGMRNRFGSR